MIRKHLLSALVSISVLVGIGTNLIYKKSSPSSVPAQSLKSEKDVDADFPLEAAKWRRKAWLDEYGKMPANAWAQAAAQRVALLRPSPRLPGDQWVQKGPSNVAGRSRVLVIHPTKTNIMWMGSAGGGVWKSLDGGTTWVPKTDKIASLAVSTLVMDPKNPDILYAGTGEGFENIDYIRGAGIYKSVDGGENWTLLSTTSGFENVNRIAISPADSKIMLAAVNPGGLYRSTDAGGTWKKVLDTYSGSCVAFASPSGDRAVGAYFDGGSMVATASADGGVTWKASTGPLAVVSGFGRIEVQPAPNAAGIVYAQGVDGRVYKSTDYGASYVVVTANNYTDANWYANGLWIDPTNSQNIIASGTYIYRSTNGGTSFTRIGQGYLMTEQPHPDMHGIFSDPGYNGTSNRIAYVCTDGGVYKAADIMTATTSSGWTRLDRGARVTQYYGVAAHGPTGLIVGGTQDNGTLALKNGTEEAVMTFGGDGGWCAIDPKDPSYVYGEYVYLNIFRDTAGGDGNSNYITNGLFDANSQANFIAPFILDPNNSQVLLAGGSSLWRTPNAKVANPTWSAIKNPLPGGNYISAIAVATGNSDIIYVGHNGGQLYKTTNGTASAPTWTAIDNNAAANPLPNRYITRILVDPSDSNKVYVSLGGFTTNNLWLSTDGGANWKPRTGTGAFVLPQAPIRAIARHPLNDKTLYVGTEVGIFSSADGGNTWTTTNDAPANVSVDELIFASGSTSLVAATHGRGIWILSKPSPLQSLTVSPNSVSGGATTKATLTLSAAAPLGGQICTVTSSSKLVTVPPTVTVVGGQSSVDFNVSTLGVATKTDVTISVTNGTTVTAKLTLNPPNLGGVDVNPNRIIGGTTSVGTVTLDGAAPSGGLRVNLASNNANVTVPAAVTVASGATTATFSIGSKVVAANLTATITATSGTTSKTATLQVENVTLASVTVNPTSVAGGVATQLTVNLAAAPVADVTVKLSSSNATVAATPASIVVPAGKTQGVVSITPKAVASATTVTFTANYQTQVKTAVLTVRAPVLDTVSVNPTAVVGGSGTVVTGTVALTGSAPAAGTVVTLKSSNANVTVPASVTIAGGTSSVTFAVTHKAVTANATATISATVGSITKTTTLAVATVGIKGLTLSTASVLGGDKAKGTIELSGPAPTGGAVVTLTKTGTAATIPASVTIAAGQTKADFDITTVAVTAETTVKITASYNGTTASADLKISNFKLALDTFTIVPAQVFGGTGRIVVGTVTLNANAPADGITVTIASSDPTVARGPTSLVIKGTNTGTFPISSFAVEDNTVVTFTVSYGGVSKTATLRVN